MELTIEQLIKIIIGILVVVLVIGGLVFAFKKYAIDFFSGLSSDGMTGSAVESLNFILSLI